MPAPETAAEVPAPETAAEPAVEGKADVHDEYADYTDPEEAAMEKLQDGTGNEAMDAELDEIAQTYRAAISDSDARVEIANEIANNIAESGTDIIIADTIPTMGKASITNNEGRNIIHVTAVELSGDKYTCTIPEQQIIIQIEAKALSVLYSEAPVTVRSGSSRHKVMLAFEQYADRSLSIEALLELCKDDFQGMTLAAIAGAAATLAKDGLLAKPSRGLYKLCLGRKYRLV